MSECWLKRRVIPIEGDHGLRYEFQERKSNLRPCRECGLWMKHVWLYAKRFTSNTSFPLDRRKLLSTDLQSSGDRCQAENGFNKVFPIYPMSVNPVSKVQLSFKKTLLRAFLLVMCRFLLFNGERFVSLNCSGQSRIKQLEASNCLVTLSDWIAELGWLFWILANCYGQFHSRAQNASENRGS